MKITLSSSSARKILMWFFAFCLLFGSLEGLAQYEYELTSTDISSPELAPFSKVDWNKKTPVVEVDSQSFELLSINGLHVNPLLNECCKIEGTECKKKFGLIIPALLFNIRGEVKNFVELQLKYVDGDSVIQRKVEMTKKNWMSTHAHETERIKSEASAINNASYNLRVIPDSLLFLTTRYFGEAIDMPDTSVANYDYELFLVQEKIAKQRKLSTWIDRNEALADLDQLEWILTNEYSYLERSSFYYKKALAAIRKKIGEGILKEDFTIQLQKFLGLFGDGHTEIEFRKSGLGYILGDKVFPFNVDIVEGKIVALNPEGAFLNNDFPFLSEINFSPAENWLNAVNELQAAGTPSLKKYRTSYFFKYWNLMKTLVRDGEHQLNVELKSLIKKRKTKTFTLELASPKRTNLSVNPGGIINGNIGYLNIPDMDDDPAFLSKILQLMQAFKETDGMIIDVRNNTGGKRIIIDLLLPFFIPPGSKPSIVNFRTFRMNEEDDFHPASGYMNDSRYPLYPVTWEGWTQEEKNVISEFLTSTKLEWTPDPEKFSDWHFSLINPEKNKDNYYYSKPVVVLMNENCFSVTDIFLGAIKGLPHVTLVGATSAGGSGKSVTRKLDKSTIQFSFCTAASFRPDGKLYDGNGIIPDVIIYRTLEDISAGRDPIMEKALQIIKEK